MTIVKLPRFSMFWTKNSRLFNAPGISDVFIYQRFIDIYSCLCLRDISDDKKEEKTPMTSSERKTSQQRTDSLQEIICQKLEFQTVRRGPVTRSSTQKMRSTTSRKRKVQENIQDLFKDECKIELIPKASNKKTLQKACEVCKKKNIRQKKSNRLPLTRYWCAKHMVAVFVIECYDSHRKECISIKIGKRIKLNN